MSSDSADIKQIAVSLIAVRICHCRCSVGQCLHDLSPTCSSIQRRGHCEMESGVMLSSSNI